MNQELKDKLKKEIFGGYQTVFERILDYSLIDNPTKFALVERQYQIARDLLKDFKVLEGDSKPKRDPDFDEVL